MKIERKVPSLQFTELDPAIQEVIMKLLPGDQYQSFTYHIGKDYIGCKLDKKMKFIILRNHDGDFATAKRWPTQSA
jgi:hypothetical protein